MYGANDSGDDGDDDMRADRLLRKTHFKKNTIKNGDDTLVFDLTQEKSVFLQDIGACSILPGGALQQGAPVFSGDSDVFAWCAQMMAQSPSAKIMWEQAALAGWQVALSDLDNDGFCMDVAAKKLLLDHYKMTPGALGRSAYFRNALLTTFIRALRDIWHEGRIGAAEDEYTPENLLMLERVRAADCDTVTMLAAWELRGAGNADVWRHLIGSAEGDMALVFTRFLERDPAALFSGAALAYAFRQWYADEQRINASDHQTLEALDEVLVAKGDKTPFGGRELDGSAIENIARLPDGTSYLAGLGFAIKTDPFFAGLNDPINQTHLFQLMYDAEATIVNNVPFRDRSLAQLIFPEGKAP